jgi:RNA polymerase sigma-70 factor (sigma-E family)
MNRRKERDEDFTAFVVARSARLVHIARMLCGDAGLAEDIAQSALEKAYLKWDRIEMRDPFGYVRQVVVNEHLSRLRRRPWREQPAGGSAEIDLETRRPAYVADPAVSARTDLLVALGKLTARERTVVVLRYVEDLTYEQTAEVLGIAAGTVKSTAARALAKLRESPELAGIDVGGRP